MFNNIQKLASAIRNDVVGGLRGFHANFSMSDELLCQDIVDERMTILKEYSLKGILPVKDLYLSINCVPVDCKNIEKCRCNIEESVWSTLCQSNPVRHFEIPQLLNDYGSLAIDYIGSADKLIEFVVYTSSAAFRQHKYRKRGKNKPMVWIDTTPNENGMYDCFVFNAPFLKTVSISAIFKDLRLLELYGCCSDLTDGNFNFIDSQIKDNVTKKKINYYRSLANPVLPNNQEYAAG